MKPWMHAKLKTEQKIMYHCVETDIRLPDLPEGLQAYIHVNSETDDALVNTRLCAMFCVTFQTFAIFAFSM